MAYSAACSARHAGCPRFELCRGDPGAAWNARDSWDEIERRKLGDCLDILGMEDAEDSKRRPTQWNKEELYYTVNTYLLERYIADSSRKCLPDSAAQKA